MHRSLVLICVALLVVTLGCNRSTDKAYPYGWTRTDDTFDSLTVKLERGYVTRIPMDSLKAMTQQIAALARQDSASPAKQVRAQYWEARLHLRMSDTGNAFNGFEKALEMCDSSSLPYEAKRIRWNMDYDYHPLDLENYQRLTSDVEFYHNEGDLMMEAASDIELGIMMYCIGSFDTGIYYLDLADSLFMKAGLPSEVKNNRINRAQAMVKMGRINESERLLRALVADSAFRNIGEPYTIALGNLYSNFDDTLGLRMAYNRVRLDSTAQELQGLYNSFLSREALARGQIDSARYYSDLGMGNLAKIQDTEIFRENYRARAALMEKMGRYDSAYHYLQLAYKYNDSLISETDNEQLLNIETVRLIGEKRIEMQHAESRRTIIFVSLIFVVILFGLVVAAYLYRRMQRQKLARIQASLDLEQSQRRVLAMQLALQEKESLFTSVSREMADLTAKGEISPKAGNRIESSLKTHMGSQYERDNFIETFSAINPNFSERLKSDYPTLTDADTRLATFIALGIDNKHIARIMSIRPESVKQARWRLRQRMGLAGDMSLEAAISRYLD